MDLVTTIYIAGIKLLLTSNMWGISVLIIDIGMDI